MIIDPIDLAERLHELLNAKGPSGSFVVKKQHRETVILAEILLRNLFDYKSTITEGKKDISLPISFKE